MLEHLTTVDWARAQFAMTAMFHWLFVPLTLGLSFLVAFFETIYFKTGNEEWRRLTKFWMKLFAINFAIGIATGIILEFEFGTNWANYSWMVGDIFGAPLAVEGIFAFFIEATFFAVMFFGWSRVSKGFHLFSTWMVAFGSNLSALWILVANGWMQFPTGMAFNPDTARFEMQNIWKVIFSPVAISKFTHATSSGFQLAALFVIGVSAWFLLRGRHQKMARRSIVVAAVFGLLASAFIIFNGDEAAYTVAHKQPMKLAAMEGLYHGTQGAPIVAFGLVNGLKEPGDGRDPFLAAVKIPGLLSLLANRSSDSYVPGIDDLVFGNPEHNIPSVDQRIANGKLALAGLAHYKFARKSSDQANAATALASFNQYKDDLGYGHLHDPKDAAPPVAPVFYSFHVMVILGTFFPILFLIVLVYAIKGTIADKRGLLNLSVFSIFLGYVACQAGWIVAEMGRQPWAIQGLLPVNVARTDLAAGNVKTTFFIFLFLFTTLLVAEIRIMLQQINIGPEEA